MIKEKITDTKLVVQHSQYSYFAKADRAATIAAIATPSGSGGVGIIRVSGSLVPKIAEAVTGKQLKPRQAELAKFRDQAGEIVDVGLALLFPAPHSFTGEDVLELHGHGGSVVLAMLLEAVLAQGAKLAQPGEFSARAFANDKIDLAQAEAIADLIAAQSKQAAGAALRSLQGKFSTQIANIVEELIALRMLIEASIDFPDEADMVLQQQLQTRITQQLASCTQVLQDAEHGQLLASGLRVVVLGEPNVGKSSLLNLLADDDRAIVTDVPGTTRDVLQAQITLRGVKLEVLDTAGIRETTDRIEQEGVRRAWQAVKTAQIIVVVADGGKITALNHENINLSAGNKNSPAAINWSPWYPHWFARFPADAKVLLVYNKIDQTGEQPALINIEQQQILVKMSAKTGAGKQQFEQALLHLAGINPDVEPNFIARKRHVIALQNAVRHIADAQQLLLTLSTLELAAEELRLAQQELSTITGRFSADDLLGKIFAEFCIGK